VTSSWSFILQLQFYTIRRHVVPPSSVTIKEAPVCGGPLQTRGLRAYTWE